MDKPENKYKLQVNAIAKLLELIDGVNRDLKVAASIDAKLLVKQYEYLKKDYTQQLLELLEEYQLPIHLDEAA